MDRLVPAFIEERFHRGEHQGSFEGSSLFVDIAGFSRLTDVAFTLGEAGAELIGREIPRLFETPVCVAIECGGIITHFAGDGFLTLFPGDDGRITRYVAGSIITHFAEHGRSDTPHGTFQFAVKCGADVGRIDWGIVRCARRAAWYFRGPPVSGATELERHAGRGELNCSTRVSQESWRRDVDRREDAPNDSATLSAFFDDDILERWALREIRRAVVAFVSFAAADDGGQAAPVQDHEVIAALFGALDDGLPRHGRAFGRLLIDDKGLNALVYFGVPRALEHAEEEALRFATGLRQRLRDDPGVILRAGVDSGLVYAGVTGGTRRHEPVFLGDCVNLAARLMTSAPWGAIHVSKRVVEMAQARWAFTELPATQFKGKSAPEPVFRLEGAVQRVGFPEYLRPMVGRHGELSHLHELLTPALRGQSSGMVYVYGEAGMGKTRLVTDFREQVTASPGGVQWVELRCTEGDAGLQPLRTWLQEYFGLDPFASSVEARARFSAGLAAVADSPGMPATTARELQRVESFLGALVGCYWERSLYEQVTDPKLRYDNQLWGLRDLVLAVAARGPVVVHVEDAHWIEPSTAAWLRVLSRAGECVPLLVLLTSRYAEDGARPRIDVEPGIPVVDLDLQPLDADQTGIMLEAVLGARPHDELVTLVANRAGGNPFFCEQLAMHMREDGHLAWSQEGACWCLSAEVASTEVARLPSTLEAVLLARFDRLEVSLREGLKHAATLGIRFMQRVLEELLDRSGAFSGQPAFVIPHAQEHAMILPDGPLRLGAEQVYVFRHALMQRAAYHLQPPGTREYLHGVAADLLAELFPDREEMLAVRAEHLGNAGRIREEADVLEQAAAVASRQHRNADAITLYERLRDRLTQLDLEETNRMFMVDYALASVYWLIGEWNHAQELTRSACALAERLGDERLIVDGWARAAEQMRNLGDPQAAYRLAEAARERAVQADYRGGLARVMGLLGRLHWYQGDYGRALGALGEQLEHARGSCDEPEVTKAIGTMGIVFWSRGDHSRALECYAQWQQRAEQARDRRGVARAIGNQGLVHFDLGDYDKALACYREEIRLAGEIGDREAVVLAIGNSGNVYCERGEYREAMESFREWQRRAHELGDQLGMNNAIANQANVCLHLGDYDRALQLSQAFFDNARGIGDKYGMAHGLAQQGYAYLFLGETERALARFTDALALATGSGDKKNAAYALTGMAKTHHQRCEHEQALETIRESLSVAETMGALDHIAYGRSLVASVLLAMDRVREAVREAEGAVETARRLKALPVKIEPLLALAETRARQGEIAEAHAALDEARRIVEGLGLMHRSEEVSRVASVVAACESEDQGMTHRSRTGP